MPSVFLLLNCGVVCVIKLIIIMQMLTMAERTAYVFYSLGVNQSEYAR